MPKSPMFALTFYFSLEGTFPLHPPKHRQEHLREMNHSHLGWKRHFRSLSPTVILTLPSTFKPFFPEHTHCRMLSQTEIKPRTALNSHQLYHIPTVTSSRPNTASTPQPFPIFPTTQDTRKRAALLSNRQHLKCVCYLLKYCCSSLELGAITETQASHITFLFVFEQTAPHWTSVHRGAARDLQVEWSVVFLKPFGCSPSPPITPKAEG